MKALVLSGGVGTRMRPFSYSMPKQLVPIANRPVLAYVIENLREIGVTEVGIVVRDGDPEVARAFGDGCRLGVHITYIPQAVPLGLAHCVVLARDFLGEDDFVLYLGDNVLLEGITRPARDFLFRRPDAQLLVRKMADPRRFGVAELDGDGTVRRLVEKPSRPRSDLAVIGVYFFTPAIHRAVAAIAPGPRGELEITDAIQWLLATGAPVRADEYTGHWTDAGSPEDVLECNRLVLDMLDAQVAGSVDGASELDGPVDVGPGARVVRSRIEGPAIIGPGTVVEDCHIGPGTSIGRDCRLKATRIADSIVLDAASITGVRGLRDSLVGRGAVIGTTAGAHHRLIVGDHCRIVVSR